MDINALSTPINKTAALVTQQPKTCDLDELREEYGILKRAIGYWSQQHQEGNPEALEKLNEIRTEAKKKKQKIAIISAALNEDMPHYIVKECRKLFDKEQWEVIIFKAKQQRAKELNGEL